MHVEYDIEVIVDFVLAGMRSLIRVFIIIIIITNDSSSSINRFIAIDVFFRIFTFMDDITIRQIVSQNLINFNL